MIGCHGVGRTGPLLGRNNLFYGELAGSSTPSRAKTCTGPARCCAVAWYYAVRSLSRSLESSSSDMVIGLACSMGVVKACGSDVGPRPWHHPPGRGLSAAPGCVHHTLRLLRGVEHAHARSAVEGFRSRNDWPSWTPNKGAARHRIGTRNRAPNGGSLGHWS